MDADAEVRIENASSAIAAWPMKESPKRVGADGREHVVGVRLRAEADALRADPANAIAAMDTSA